MRSIRSAARIWTRGISLAAVSVSALLSASAAHAGALYLSYTELPPLSPYGENAPTIVNGNDTGSPVSTSNGLAMGSSSLRDAIAVTTSWTSRQLLFQVDPAGSCGTSASCTTTHGDKTSTATISVTFNLYSSSSGGTPASFTETATADFDYTQEKDNICWNSIATGGVVLSSTQVGACSTTYASNSGNSNDVIDLLQVGTEDYMIEFNGWNDWNEQPTIQFKDGGPARVPEPLTLSLFGAGLAGAVAMRRRNKAKA
jgi:PEP-CTERM motif